MHGAVRSVAHPATSSRRGCDVAGNRLEPINITDFTGA
jgi:hypothetical protein